MNSQEKAYFDALHKDRTDNAKTLEKRSMRGIKESVVEKYSDQAHFIYELLQNADDAKATSVRFELLNDKLVFAHNGTIRFSVSNPATEDEDSDNGQLGHINAITSVANSNKKEASIGKFGVGFKAVFQYTVTPQIYDPNVFFKIERFIVPVILENDYPGRHANETLFIFPFDHNKRSPENAYADISEKLRSLDYPLLFLSNLKEISFNISGTTGSYGKVIEKEYDFKDATTEFMRLTQNDEKKGNDINTLWLFSRYYNEGNNKYKYSIGFFVDTEGHIIPQKHSAFCFFPTKVPTYLNFIIHAPFLLTDSREGIRAGEPHNIYMISLLSKLAADSLVYLSIIGQREKKPLIDDDIFDIIPYDESEFTDIENKNEISFKPFYNTIKEAFKNETIIRASDCYVLSKNAYWAFVPEIAELFSNEQLAVLLKNNEAKWVFRSFGRQDTQRKNKVLTDYIDSITTGWLNEDKILDGITTAFIESQPIEWLHRFYKWIAETEKRKQLIQTKPIFLNQEKKAVAAFDAKKQIILFLPTGGESGYTTVNGSLLQNDDTREFIKQLGVVKPSLRDEIYNKILPLYNKNIATNDSILHFKKFFQYYQECNKIDARVFLDLIKGYAFVLYTSDNDKTQRLGNAKELYLPSELLKQWFQHKPETKFVCFDEYMKIFGDDKKDELNDFFKELGVNNIPLILWSELSYEEARQIKSSWPYSTHKKKWTDKTIDGSKENIDYITNNQDKALSVSLWHQLLKFVGEYDFFSWSRGDVLYGYYEYFYYSKQSELFDSTEARRLRTQPWLLNKEGKFTSASELIVQTLHSDYDISSNAAGKLLCSILKIENETEDIASLGKSLGLSEDEQRQALNEFANRKKINVNDTPKVIEGDENNGLFEDESNGSKTWKAPVERIVKELFKRALSEPQDPPQKPDDTPLDEDDFIKPTVDIGKKIECVKKQAEREIEKIAKLEELKRMAREATRYSYGWFKALLELELLNSGENNTTSREISISFAKVEREEGTSRTLILKHPNRYIPQFMEDLADIPLELYFVELSMVKVAIEVVNVKSYTLRVKLRTNAQIDDIDFSLVTEARINAQNPVFLLEELKKAFIRLGDENGYNDDYNMQENLCKNINFVFGPPGTGKTTYVARDIIIPKMKSTEELKVLVLTPTNKAADVLVRRLMDIFGADKSYLDWLVRFGTTNDPVIEQNGIFREKTFDIRTFSRNVTVTTIARFPYDYFLPDNNTRLHLNELKWDYIIFDEASMIPIINIIYPLYKKTPIEFIIAGDPFQIEPITMVDDWKGENIYTMVKLDSFIEPKTVPHQYFVKLLKIQYRSIPEIGEVFSRFAYGGVLNHFRSSKDRRSLPIEEFIDIKPLNIIKFPVSKFESIYKPKRLQNKSAYQVYSALFTFEFVKYLSLQIELLKVEDHFRIGVIAPYRAQSDLIDKLMISATLPKNVDVQVDTIHGFQGDECDIIIALFNPPPSITTHKDIFLNKLNIINVSISRARDYLFILMPDDNTENVDNLLLIKKVEKLFKEQSASFFEYLSQSIEDAIFNKETYIEDNSFTTSHQLVNVYGKPEMLYEVRSEDNALDVQIHNMEKNKTMG